MGWIATTVDIILNSLVLGGIFLIMGVGLNIIYGLNRVMNLAHGALYALGAYFGYTLVAVGANYFLALLLAPIVVGAVGLIIERVLISPMRKRHMIYTLILTYGLMFVIDGLIKLFWGQETRFIQLPEFMQHTVSVGPASYPVFRLVILIGIAAVVTALMLLLGRTRLGINMRAASSIPEMVSACGINVRRVQISAFVLGCILAGTAGMLAGPLFTVFALMGHDILISSFVVVVIGGLGSLRGAVLAALLVGFVQTLAEFFVTEMAMVMVYMLMALVLVFKPLGILGEGKFE
ncbi:MAG: branched-chain amino acid ABC transporter permease [Desulfarculus sp.]|jgi:branched-subunit amino acid ABC-type transport system permease component|nr:MAG: branched-chain amino acid ABC transporter permease [Desulfarculus sp.]